MSHRFSWFGAALILLGITMLLNRLNVVPWSWHIAAWAMLALFGVDRALRGFQHTQGWRVFWGTMVFLVGLYNILRGLDIVELRSYFFFPVLMLMLGLSFLAMYLCRPAEWHLLIPTLSFLGLGVILMMTEIGYLYRWDVMPFIKSYWPVVLILFGVALLVNRRSP
jgi:hypothetical protein